MAQASHLRRRARHLDLRLARPARIAQITTFAGEDRNPVFTDDEKAIYYLSEESGTFNVHKMSRRRGGEVAAAHVVQEECPFASSASRTPARSRFGFDGQIYTMAAGRPSAEARHRRVRRQQGEQRAHHRGQQRRAGARRLADGQGSRVHLSRRRVRQQRRRRRHEAHHDDARDGDRRRVLARRQVARLRVRARRQVGDLRSAPHARRRAVLLRVDRREGNAARRRTSIRTRIRPTRPTESSSRTSRIGTTSASSNLATKQTRTMLTDKELFGGDHHFEWSPDSKWILFDLDVPGHRAGRSRSRARRRHGQGRQPHRERLQRRARQVDPRRQGDVVVQQSRRPQVGRAVAVQRSRTPTRCSSTATRGSGSS